MSTLPIVAHRPTRFNAAKHLYQQGDGPSSLGKKERTEDTNQSDPEGIIEGQDVMKRVQQMSVDEMKLAHERLTEADKIKRQQDLNAFYR